MFEYTELPAKIFSGDIQTIDFLMLVTCLNFKTLWIDGRIMLTFQYIIDMRDILSQVWAKLLKSFHHDVYVQQCIWGCVHADFAMTSSTSLICMIHIDWSRNALHVSNVHASFEKKSITSLFFNCALFIRLLFELLVNRKGVYMTSFSEI